MSPQAFSLIAMLTSTGIFVVLIGSLVIVGIRSNRRNKQLHDELDAEIPKLAEAANRRHERKFGKRNTRLNLLINESFSRQAPRR